MSTGVWHQGEQQLQASIGMQERLASVGQQVLRDYLTEQLRSFFPLLPFVVAAAADEDGWPWASLWQGQPGFVSSPDPQQLHIATTLPAGDPLSPWLQAGQGLGLLGIELGTRRRNRVNGVVQQRNEHTMVLKVEQAFGNCPRFIQQRQPLPPRPESDGEQAEQLTTLDAAARSLISHADTFFVASHAGDQARRDGHLQLDVSHRGGPPGFVQLQGDRLLIPDYAGNRYFNTLGNLLLQPRCGLLFIDFEQGEMLHVQGEVEVILPDSASRQARIAALPGAERLWQVQIHKVLRRRQALTQPWQLLAFSPASQAIAEGQ
ncbi:pyridoxamine 5'-phosphate oxidase family protein [Pokkaliibacter sp. MBI-7]|uniref:pyridoxamine 5'-phosphate oxidase family protein n=1 Tax=Pokkaliibacter sp. MBI-7 TaxID=3040600 RepID=UPI00244D46E3|nr:pyridoxamine 5'-phosphate oxidase family protein [Pokkaliibacter sp. MBI-7]MDH2434633.1 pyridoxamine 5'-phosphate oxidase family protein [Pokkaliibacter sp. MBI-7]